MPSAASKEMAFKMMKKKRRRRRRWWWQAELQEIQNRTMQQASKSSFRSQAIYILLIALTCCLLSPASAHLNDAANTLQHNHSTSSVVARHTRRVLIVQDETTQIGGGGGDQFETLNRNRSRNIDSDASADSTATTTDEDDEEDFLREEEFKRRLIDGRRPVEFRTSTGSPEVAATSQLNKTNQQDNQDEDERQLTSATENREGDQTDAPGHVQKRPLPVQESTGSGGGGGLVAGFFSHIDKQWKFAEIVLIIVISAILNLVTIIGNIMVLISFKMDRSLQTVSNYFLLSLALADLLIGLISMPLYTLYLLLNYWPLGPLMCDIWLAIDYLNSNAAVLNMLIISFDRYFSVTRPLTYRAKRTTKHAILMISFAWLLSLTIWTPAIFTYPYYKGRTVQGTDKCEIEFVKANTYLTFVTAILAFYIPVAIMIYLYWRIWLETKKRYRDLTTLFLVSGVGAAAPSRHRPPAAPMSAGGQPALCLPTTLSGNCAQQSKVAKGSLWARNLANRLHAPSLMRGLKKPENNLTCDSPAGLSAGPAQPALSCLSDSKRSDQDAPASFAATKQVDETNGQRQVGCDNSTSAGDHHHASKPSKVVLVKSSESSRKAQQDQQVPVQAHELPNRGKSSCKCRACDQSKAKRPHELAASSECKACARNMSALGLDGRHKCTSIRKGTACYCCCSSSSGMGAMAIVQHRTKRETTRQRDKHKAGGCRYCHAASTNTTCSTNGWPERSQASRSHSPRSKARSTVDSGGNLLTLADETTSVRAATSGSRSSLCQRSKIHPKQERHAGEAGGCESDDETKSATKLLVDVATSPINFSSSSLAVGQPGAAEEKNVMQQQQRPPLTPVSPEVEDFETRIVSYGHKFHFETDDPKFASRDDEHQPDDQGRRVKPANNYHQSRHNHQHHHHNPRHSTNQTSKSTSHTGKHSATCCCAEVISAHDAECRFCRPAHRPGSHQLNSHHQHSTAAAATNHLHHVHQHRQHHSHAHGHHHHHHHHHRHHLHAHAHAHHHHKHNNHHKHSASPEKQRIKCPAKQPPALQPADTKLALGVAEEQLALGSSSLPILSALQQSTNGAAASAATNSAAKKFSHKLTFSDVLMERSSSACVAVKPDKQRSQLAAATAEQQQQRHQSPVAITNFVDETERELLARRNADRLKSAFDDDDDNDITTDDQELSWLARLLDLLGLATPPRNSKRPVRYKTNYRGGQLPPEADCATPPGHPKRRLFSVLECCSSSSSRPAATSRNAELPRRLGFSPSSTDEPGDQQRLDPQTTDSSDSYDQQQQQQQQQAQRSKLRSQPHSSSTKSSSSGSQQQQQVAQVTAGCGSYNSNNSHHHNHNQHHHHHHHHHHHPIQPKSERKAAKTLSTLLLVFIVTWLPYNVLVLIKTLSGGEDMVPEKIWNFSYYLCYINSTINPLCYALCNAQFRRTYMRILKCKLSNEHNSTRRLVAIQAAGGGGGGGGGGSSATACSAWNNASRLNSSSLDGGAHHQLNHSSSGTLGGGGGNGPQTAAGRQRQLSASNGGHRHSGGRRS